MISLLKRFLPTRVRVLEQPARFSITEQAMRELDHALAPARDRRHEGVAFLFGLAAENHSIAVKAFLPDANTGPGHFQISSKAMTAVVHEAANHGLSVIGQAHTHPKGSGHSKGDLNGLHIAFPGFVSIVFPEYGVRLPSYDGSDVIIFGRDKSWKRLTQDQVNIIPEASL